MATTATANKKEVFYETSTNALVGNTAVHYIFPPPDLYNNNGDVHEPYSISANDKIVNVDIAFLKLKNFQDANQDDKYGNGEFENTNVSGAFFAVEPNDYYYLYNATESTLTAPSLERSTGVPRIAESIKLPISSIGGTFENKSLGMITANVNRFDDIEVDGLNEGVKPDGMAMTAIRLEKQEVEDVSYRCFVTATITNPKTSITLANTITAQVAHFSGIANEFIDENSNEYVDEKTGAPEGSFVDSSSYVSAVEIVNVERDLDDNRYGDTEDDLPFIFTGASHYFTAGQVSGNTAIDIDVWGGDCFIGLHTFKVSNSSYALTDPVKDIDNSGTKGTSSIQIEKWGNYFQKSATTGTEDVSRPFPLKGVSQTITVLLESEINPQVAEKYPHNKFDYDSTAAIGTSNLPVPIVDDAGQIRSSFKYYFNLDYARANEYKVFFPYQTYEKNNNAFGARMPYSDQKIYNTDVEGFDRFRVLNFYDLDESHGSGMKLVEAGDRIFALQESALSYIPINAQVLESADGGSLAVRNAEIIGIPNKIDVLYGTQHPKTVKVDGNLFLYTDRLRGEVLMFDGQSPKRVSNLGMEKLFNTEFATLGTNHSDLSAVYDNKNKEYIVYFRDSDSAVFNVEYGVWAARFPEVSTVTNTLGGVRVGEVFMLGGIDNSKNVAIGSLYTGSVNNWWGTAYTPTVKLYIAPEPDITKTFDVFTIVSDRTPDPQSFVVVSSDGTSSTADLSSAVITDRDGTFRIKNLRDAAGARSRGVYGELEIDLAVTAAQSGITSVLTRYRPVFKSF